MTTMMRKEDKAVCAQALTRNLHYDEVEDDVDENEHYGHVNFEHSAAD